MAALVLLTPGENAIVPQRARWRDRIAARLRTGSLDAELAAGAQPGTRAALALRAEALGESRFRSILAEGIRHVLREAHGVTRMTVAQVPLRRGAILAAAEELDELAHRLLEPGPVGARGIAKARLLLIDGRSPLYFSDANQELHTAVAGALADLQPSFGW